ncbi:uncharacterized protein Osi12 [Eurosta solidaginis]|uniref:uncharacterized protein Osi12 n=1 Tax=Eurosta solidaginis TaxID=178769 RepID=UPI00353149DC
MLLKKTFPHTKPKNSAKISNYAFTLYLCLLMRSCDAGTENLNNFHFVQSTPRSVATSSKHSSPVTLSSTPSSSHPTTSATPSNTANPGTRTILRIYDECSRSEVGFVPCLKKKAISFIDRISHIDAITVADGVKLVRLPINGAAAVASASPTQPLYSDNDVDASVSRSSDDRDTKLTNMLIERLSYFFNGHTIQVNFPKLTADEIGRGLEEGRGKMKKMMSMMMMGMAMKMVGMIPVAMGMLYMMAGKALIISKIALLLAGMMGLKKLMSGRGGGGGGNSGWASGGGGGGWSSGGGYDRRSLDEEAHELAYRGYSNRQPIDIYAPPPKQQKHAQQQKPLLLQQQQQTKQYQQQQQQQQPHQLHQQAEDHQQQQQQQQMQKT